MFKCALDDEAIQLLAAYLDALPAETLPKEIHLSHKKFTQTGFQALLNVIGVKMRDLATRPMPVYVRIGNGHVDHAYIDALV